MYRLIAMLLCLTILLTGCADKSTRFDYEKDGALKGESAVGDADGFSYEYLSLQDYEFKGMSVIPFKDTTVGDSVYEDDYFSVWGLYKRLTRATLSVAFGSKSVLDNFRFRITFYGENKELIGETETDAITFPGWNTCNLNFTFPDSTRYYSIAGIDFEDVTNSEEYLIGDATYFDFGVKHLMAAKLPKANITVNKMSNSTYSYSVGGTREYEYATLTFYNKFYIVIDEVQIDLKEKSGEFTVDFGAAAYAVNLMGGR